VNRGDAFLADISTSFRNKNITADVKVDSKSNVSINCCIGFTVSFRNLYSLFT
jgi:hypothetical protein